MTQHEHNHHDQESEFGGLSAIDGLNQPPSDVASKLSFHQLIADPKNDRDNNLEQLQARREMLIE